MKKFIFFLGSVLTPIVKAMKAVDLEFQHEVVVTINWKKLKAAEKLADAKLKLSKLTGNADLPQPWSPEFCQLATFAANITAADARMLERLQNLPGSATNLKTALKLLLENIKSIGKLVQLKIKSSPVTEGVRICNDAGYDHKKISVRGPRGNSLLQSNVPGVLYGFAEGRGTHQWQMSYDGGITIIPLDPTTGGIIEISNLVSKKEVWVRNRVVLPKGKFGPWSPWYSEFAP